MHVFIAFFALFAVVVLLERLGRPAMARSGPCSRPCFSSASVCSTR